MSNAHCPLLGILRTVLFCLALAGFASGAAPLMAQGYGGTVSDILVRGDSLLAQKRINEAIVQFQEARTLCATPPEVVSSLQGEARGHMAMQEFLPAAGLLEEAAQRFPDDPRLPDILYMGGVARRQGGDLAGAVPLFEQSLEHHPTPDLVPVIKLQLAQALRLTGKPDKVAPVLKDFETEFPAHKLIPNALYTMAMAEHDAGNLKGAEAAFRRLLDGYPHAQASSEAMYDMAGTLAELGKHSEAATFFRTYANANPSAPIAARSMERAADLSLLYLFSPREAAMFYGVAKVKAETNPVPMAPEMAVSQWLDTKLAIADAISSVWGLVVLGLIAAGAVGGSVWWFLRRSRRRQAVRQDQVPSV